MKEGWLRRRYRNLPALAQRVLINEHFRNDISALRRACRRLPGIYALRSALTEALVRAHRRTEAHRVWLQTVHLFPRAANPYFQRANWAMKGASYAEAAKRLRQCLALDHGHFRETAHFWRAEALYQLGRYDEAIVELTHVGNSYEESWFFGDRSRSKVDILKDIECAMN